MSRENAPASVLPSPHKLFYIDNIKIFMTVLVIVHHTAITYGGPGNWYYNEKTPLPFAQAAITMFVSINQSFFMGFFFLLAAFFTPGSYERKGARKFVQDRLVRLGIPLLFYSFVLSPFLSFLVYYFAGNHHITYLQYLGGFNSWIDFGVLWFVAALLLFTFVYVMFRSLFNSTPVPRIQTPDTRAILWAGLISGIISFFVRIFFPVGWVLKPFGFQLGHFTQYIVFFAFGILAYRNKWFESISTRTGAQMKRVALLLLLFLPVLFLAKDVLNTPVAWYGGGFHWQSLMYAVWEQVIGISILTCLLITGRTRWNRSSDWWSSIARCTFSTYIFHPLVVIALSLIGRDIEIDPMFKFLIVAPLAVAGSFALGFLVLLIPGVKRIL